MGRQTPLPVALLVCGLLVATASVMAAKSLALAADGSYYLVRMLGNGEVVGPRSRVTVTAIREAPVLIAMRSGMTSTHVLSMVQGLGQLVLPALVWSTAILLARRREVAFAAVAMTAGLCAGTTWFFSVSESVLAAPLAVLVGVLLWRPAWNWRLATLAGLCAVVSIASYESTVATGALLAVWAGWRARQSEEPPDRWGSVVVAVAATLSVLVAIGGFGSGIGPSNARSASYWILSLEPRSLWIGLVGVVGVVAALALPLRRGVRPAGLAAGIACLSAAVAVAEPSSAEAFEARGGTELVCFLLLLFLLWLWRREVRQPQTPHAPRAESAWLRIIPPAFVAAILLTSLHGLTAWSRSLEAFRQQVDQQRGVRQARAVLARNRRQVVWSWTSSSLSLILRSHPDAAVLVDRDPLLVPFPPESARAQLPDEYTWG